MGLSSSYLIRNSHSYCFRLSIPVDLRPYIGRNEIRRSLKTGSISIAKQRARLIAGRIQLLFSVIRNKESTPLNEFNKARIQQLIHRYVAEALLSAEDILLNRENTLNPVIDIPLDIVSELNTSNGTNTTSELHLEVLKILKELKYISGQQIATGHNVSTPKKKRSKKPRKKPEPAAKLSDIVNEYMAENIRAEKWKKSTILDYEGCSKVLIRFIGNKAINKITYDIGRRYKAALIAMPKKFMSIEKYEKLSMNEVARLNVSNKISATTVNKYLGFTSDIINYAVRNHYTNINPFEGLRIKQRKKANDHSAPFDNIDLIKIFHSDSYKNDSHFASHPFWLPVLALYTGARLGELAQLKTTSLKQEGAIWYLDIDGELKTEHSRRQIPLHPFVTDDLNFPEFVSKVKLQGHERIFSGITPVGGKWGHPVTNWFTRYKARIGLTNDDQGRKKSFHSFRNTFITHLKHKRADKFMLKEVVGHAVNDITMERYGDRYPVKELYEGIILKFNPEIDLSHLKNSKYTG